MKKVSRREFLGAAIGTGLAGSATIAGVPMLPKEVREFLNPHQDSPPAEKSPQKETRAKAAYDVIPPYFHWRFGNEYRGNILSAKSTDFDVWLTPQIERRPYNFRAEVFNKCKEIDSKRDGKPIALCYSGGESSEIIAIALKELGIPFDLYYLDIWHSDIHRKSFVEPFAKKIGVPLRKVGILEHSFLTEEVFKNTVEYGSDNPDFSLMTTLFDAIPDSHFIVTGSGHLERSGNRFEKIGANAKIPEGTDSFYRPFSINNVLFYTWAKKNNRVGEFYFYQGSAELIASVFQNPLVESKYPYYNHQALIHSAFPEITPRAKTTNWQGVNGPRLSALARTNIQKCCDTNHLDYWRPNIGCAVNLAAVFKS